MAAASSMKLYGGRNMGCIVERIVWNNKMDLFAYGTEKGEVVIQRLNWQKVAAFPPPIEGAKVRSLSWQWDDTLLAVGYSSGKVAMVDVDSESLFSSLTYDDDIRKVHFSRTIDCPETLEGHTFNSKDRHKQFLPKPRPLPSIDPSLRTDDLKSFPEGLPSFLIVVLCSGKFHLLLFGALQAGSIDLTQHVLHPEQFEVYDVQLNGDSNAIYALVRDGQQLKMLHFPNQLLQDSMEPVMGVARLCAHILETKNYISNTEHCLLEARDAVQLEMDNKLTAYVNSQAYGIAATDLQELHLFGYTSLEVEDFLTKSEKDFRKMAKGVELSLKDLQGLVFRQLNEAAIRMFYFLNAMTGLGRISHFYESLIVPEVAVEAMRACGSFYLKVHELQRTIDTLVNEMKLFHSWLIFTVMRLSHQEIPDKIVLSDEQNCALAELLFTLAPMNADDGSDDEEEAEGASSLPTRSLFNLERVGQYLENDFLTQPQQQHVDPDQLWEQLVSENDFMDTSNTFATHDTKLSLVQQREKLFNAIDGVFQRPTESISASFKLSSTIICSEFCAMEPRKDQDFVACSYYVHEAARRDMFALAISWEEVLILQFSRADNCFLLCASIHLRAGPFSPELHENYNNLRFVDLQFYNESILSILTQSTSPARDVRPHSCFIQLLLSGVTNQCPRHHWATLINLTDATVTRSIHDIAATDAFKCLDGVCDMLAVSGGRRLVTVISDGHRKMTIFETEVQATDDTELTDGSFLQISSDTNYPEQLDT